MSRAFVGEWIFSNALFDWPAAERRALSRRGAAQPVVVDGRTPTRPPSRADVRALLAARALAPGVHRLVRRPRRRGTAARSSASPASSSSTSASLALAKRIKERAPGHGHRDGRRQLRSDDGRRDGAPVPVRRRDRVGRGRPRVPRSGGSRDRPVVDRRPARRRHADEPSRPPSAGRAPTAPAVAESGRAALP